MSAGSKAAPGAWLRAEANLAHGFACDVDLGERALRVDLARGLGGTGTGPDPEQLLRASLATSLLMAYRSWAAQLGVTLSSVRLELEVELAVPRAGTPAALRRAWQRIHGRIWLCSNASRAELGKLIELAHAHDALLGSLSERIACSFELHCQGDDAGSA
jgi:uncharacterized OsmC-like protein